MICLRRRHTPSIFLLSFADSSWWYKKKPGSQNKLLIICKPSELSSGFLALVHLTYRDSAFAANSATNPIKLSLIPRLLCLDVAVGLPHVRSISASSWAETCLARPELKWFIPPAVAPPISLHCADRTFVESQAQLLDAPLESLAMYGLPPQLRESEGACIHYQIRIPSLPPVGLIGNSPSDQLPASTMQVPEAKRLIYDSAKLARLDALLQELKAGDHRVLVYFQMTRMMDLMEEYLIYRQYKYLRLDGSSKLEDRRDMVIDWQTRFDRPSSRHRYSIAENVPNSGRKYLSFYLAHVRVAWELILQLQTPWSSTTTIGIPRMMPRLWTVHTV